MMKQFIGIIISIILVFTSFNVALGVPENDTVEIEFTSNKPGEYLCEPDIMAEGAILIEQHTGTVLYEKNMHKKLYPASTTKVLTALLALENGNLEDIITVGNEANMIPWDSSKASLLLGEEISLDLLIKGLMIPSGNDAGNSIGVYLARKMIDETLSPSEALAEFNNIMNERAKKAGAINSNFKNPHGYHDPEHYTTAYDLAMITRDAMKIDYYREIASTRTYNMPHWDSEETRWWTSRNQLINDNPKNENYYEYATGGKTGFTTPAGSCLISTASKDGVDLIAVILKSNRGEQWNDSKALFEYGFSNYETVQLINNEEIILTVPVDNYASDDWGSLTLMTTKDELVVLHKEDVPDIEETITWHEEFLSDKMNKDDGLVRFDAPIEQGQILGRITYSLNGKELASSDLVATREVRRRTLIDIITPKPEISYWIWAGAAALVLAIILLVIIKVISRKRRRRFIYKRRW